ncbi:exonuclease RecJ [Rhodothalassium salexigens DSM 2132]|uniref:Single-stranded-DNA-specific exonuclease RecJ n=1 Tax=Rhodothalassium salexigens DSM 2132 TaxID=1188247 RepID=A0A4R2PE48_RHOSA|nr:single-stranded-DNA-specific exonuclease RecJ [Rhodothalassium salexigens]MBB4212019.1 single-stranded-DNA-specific exonuclease [Rhodothalassium salexigens DSM 2132]MBK1638495.1 single-stranded-DNA-specific exonuclease RecJ [Rhodothalassium salexigens DSM 2132]TCP33397.1 exonuclease RecJ [Rhodothalassium salexigens DSM 2132]
MASQPDPQAPGPSGPLGSSAGGAVDAPLLGVARSLKGRAWRLVPVVAREAEALAQAFGLPDIAGRLLASRGVTLDTADAFLDPRLKAALPSPLGFRDMDAAVARLAHAVARRQRVVLFGDYDVDGATSAALMHRYLSALGLSPRIHIPDRLTEGYGPSVDAMRGFAGDGADLVVCLDCGTAAEAPLTAARDAGLDVLVIDHHKAPARLPPAVALVNPNRLDESGAGTGLAAVGVAFLVVAALDRQLRQAGTLPARGGPDLLGLLDLVALGTVCDLVPLVGPNRALVAQGLRVMAKRARPGLRALADQAGVDSAPDAYHLGFLLGPRINAGGRIGDAGLGARLLTTEDEAEAAAIAATLDRLNKERQQIEAAVLDEAAARAEMAGDRPVLVVDGAGWHPGVVGIVAGRLKERFDRPAVVLAHSDDGREAVGSARSIPGVDLGAVVIDAVAEGLARKGGGHAMAAGMTVALDRLDELRAFLDARLAGPVAAARADAALTLDGVLSVDGAGPELVAAVERLAPFGMGNPGPRFAVTPARVVKADVVGRDHVRLIVTGPAGGRLKAMAFRSAETPWGAELLAGKGRAFHLAGRLKRDDWGAEPKAELHLDDAAPAD